MSNLIDLKDKFFIAGSKGMVERYKRNLIKNGYGNKMIGGEMVCPRRRIRFN